MSEVRMSVTVIATEAVFAHVFDQDGHVVAEARIPKASFKPDDFRDLRQGSLLRLTDEGLSLCRETWTAEELAKADAEAAELAAFFAAPAIAPEGGKGEG